MIFNQESTEWSEEEGEYTEHRSKVRTKKMVSEE